MSKKKPPKPELSSWYRDRYQYMVVQRKILLFITFASLGCTLFSVLVLLRLIPLKTIEPYVIQVDQKTGITQTVEPSAFRALTANESVNNYFIVQYIRAREGYASADVVRNYNLVRLMSGGKVWAGFQSDADANNPKSNVARLGSSGLRQVRFKSITYLSKQVVQARVLIEERSGGSGDFRQQHKIILLAFEYTRMKLNNEERYINPLGFRVTDYRVDEDLLQQ